MTPLATEDDIEARIARPLTPVEKLRIAALLVDASSAVRNYVPQDFTLATTTTRLKVRRGRVRLPQRPVVSVTGVTDINGNQLVYTWPGFDEIYIGIRALDSFEIEPWRYGILAVDVTYVHGSDPIPDDIIGIVCNISLRALGRDPTDGGITNESIQGYSYSVGSAGAAGAFGMLASETAILDRYKREGGSVRTGP